MSKQSKLLLSFSPRSRHPQTDKAGDAASRDERDTVGASFSPSSRRTLTALSESPPEALMDAFDDLPDSTDWLSTSLPAFEPVEAALRCEVCKEFYSNPVITSCSHTFCSLCIRRCITADGKCPSCKTGCSSDKLAPNIAVREVVMRFQEVREKALALARADKDEQSETRSGKKRKREETDLDQGDVVIRYTRSRQTRTSSRRNGEASNMPVEIVDSDADGDEDFVPEGMAKCPICTKSMKAEQVYNHLDVCPGQEASQGRSTRSSAKITFPTALQRRQKEPSPPPNRLSQLNYAMLKDNALRKKLQDIGIPNWGSKDLMKRRHVEWLNIYNSNCDADDSVRKNKRQLLKELEEWEQTQGGRAETKENKVMKKDFDGHGYMRSHKTDFDDLIARARQKVTPKADGMEGADKSDATSGRLDPAQSDDPRAHDANPSIATEPLSQQPPHNFDKWTSHPRSSNQNPYENNESALASIRAKVQEANLPSSKVPTLSNDPSMESARRRSSDVAEGMQNPFGSSSRKVPMFAMPEEPVRDVESSTAAQ